MHGAIAEVGYLPTGDVLVVTKPCCICNKTHEFQLDRHKFEAWQTDTKIQDAFPELSVSDREILISGTCGPCFDELFPPEVDE